MRFSEDEFPDGEWWIRWIDYVSPQVEWVDGRWAGANPIVRLVLSPWRPKATTRALLEDLDDLRLCPVAVGWLPTLAVGHIFSGRDNLRDSDGKVRSVFGDERAMTIELGTQDTASANADRGAALNQPGCIYEQVLPPFAYPGLPTRKSRCVVARVKGGSQVIIPCSVVVSSFMARDVKTVTALCSGDWFGGLNKIIDAGRQRRDPHEPFELRLRHGVSETIAPHLANLLPGRNPRAPAALNDVWRSLLDALVENDLRRELRHVSQGLVGASPIAAMIPFDADCLSAKVRGLELARHVFFAAEVLEFEWPDKRPITVVRRVHDRAPEDGAGRRRDDMPIPRGAGNEPERDTMAEPGFARFEEALEGFVGRVMGTPEVRARIEKAPPGSPGPGGPAVLVGPQGGVAVGGPVTGGADAGADVDTSLDPGVPELFSTFDEAIRHLREEKCLELAGLPAPVRPGKRGDVDVWLFDVWRRRMNKRRRYGWPFFYDPDGGKLRVTRCVLVRALRPLKPDGPITHWFEIEPRPDESYRSLLVQYGRQAKSHEIDAVLHALHDDAGQLTDSGMEYLRRRLGADRVWPVPHRRRLEVESVKRTISKELGLTRPS